MSLAPSKLMTSDDLVAMRPSKRVDRWLLRGELRESKVTKRNPNHCGALVNLAILLGLWLKTRPRPRGRIYGGEIYFRIRANPDTNAGMDLALASAKQVATVTKKSSFIEGPPILGVEILSRYDKHQDVMEKIEEYLACGVKVVWVADPYTQTVVVYRPSSAPVMFNHDQRLSGGPELPGFKCKVSEIFEDE